MENNIIILKQEPIISYDKIEAVGQEVQERITQLNLDNQIVTNETVQAVKSTRSDLNKEFKAFEEQRKFIKEQVDRPYKEFEAKYKSFIAKHYNDADNTLKEKIFAFENKLKADKEDELKQYFTELSQSEKIDFVSFENVGLNITLSASLKSLKEQINSFIEKIKKDFDILKSIPESDEFKDDVLFEYKKNLDMSKSLIEVQERFKARKEAQARAEEEARKKAAQEAEKVIEAVKETPIKEETTREMLKAPQVETTAEKELQMTFTVQGTLEQLKALKQFIQEHNIKILS